VSTALGRRPIKYAGMNQSRRIVSFGAAILICHGASVAAPSNAIDGPVKADAGALQPKIARLIEVTDAIRMWRLADPEYEGGLLSFGRVATLSPDHRRFVIVLKRGNIEQNTNEYSMLMWDTAGLFQAARHTVLITMSSSSNREAIADVRWRDNNTLTFLGENPGETRQLYAFHIGDHLLSRLTNHPTSIVNYAISGERIAFTAQAGVQDAWNEKALREGIVVSRQTIPELIEGVVGRDEATGLDDEELYVQDGDSVRQMHTKSRRFGKPVLSPNGQDIVVQEELDTSDVPEPWRGYQDRAFELFRLINSQRIEPAISHFGRYQLIDVRSGESRVLLNSPVISPYTGGEVIWLPDSRSVILSNVFVRRLGEIQERKSTIELSVVDGKMTAVGSGDIHAVRWDSATQSLICKTVPEPSPAVKDTWNFIRDRSGAPEFALAKIGDQWRRRPWTSKADLGLKVVLQEGMNEPPAIVAVQTAPPKEKLLLELNPQFKELRFGKVEEIKWKQPSGEPMRAGLYYPPNYTPGKRYPLVIQTHDWSPSRFWIDGPWTTAYAAQPLAARDIFVLQVLDEYVPYRYGEHGQQDEIDRAVAIYEGAIAYLTSRGIVDIARVGIIGFSHTCLYVKYALAQFSRSFAAASVTEGEDGGYLQYISNENHFVDAYSLYGGPPFGRNLASWTQISPAFNIDKTRTPLRIVTLSPRNVLADWEWFYEMSLLRKPVDMVLLKDGVHVLQRPWDRLVSQQGTVDWFDFWLNGREDRDPTKAEQYRRWEKLCDMQIASNPGHPTFCVGTKH